MVESRFIFLRNRLFLPSAVVLLASAVAKFMQLNSTPTGDGLLFNSRTSHAAVITLEIFVVCWLLVGIRPVAARWFSILLFAVFFFYASVQFLSGQSYCGCFGSAAIPISITLFLDIFLLLSLYFWVPRDQMSPRWWQMMAIVFIAIGLVLTTWGITLFSKPYSIADIGVTASDGATILMVADRWVGNEFPLKNLVLPEIDFSCEKNVVVIVRGDCAHCLSLVESMVSNGRSNEVTFLEIPPISLAEKWREANWVALSDRHKWFVNVPVIVSLDGDIVTHVEHPTHPLK